MSDTPEHQIQTIVGGISTLSRNNADCKDREDLMEGSKNRASEPIATDGSLVYKCNVENSDPDEKGGDDSHEENTPLPLCSNGSSVENANAFDSFEECDDCVIIFESIPNKVDSKRYSYSCELFNGMDDYLDHKYTVLVGETPTSAAQDAEDEYKIKTEPVEGNSRALEPVATLKINAKNSYPGSDEECGEHVLLAVDSCKSMVSEAVNADSTSVENATDVSWRLSAFGNFETIENVTSMSKSHKQIDFAQASNKKVGCVSGAEMEAKAPDNSYKHGGNSHSSAAGSIGASTKTKTAVKDSPAKICDSYSITKEEQDDVNDRKWEKELVAKLDSASNKHAYVKKQWNNPVPTTVNHNLTRFRAKVREHRGKRTDGGSRKRKRNISDNSAPPGKKPKTVSQLFEKLLQENRHETLSLEYECYEEFVELVAGCMGRNNPFIYPCLLYLGVLEKIQSFGFKIIPFTNTNNREVEQVLNGCYPYVYAALANLSQKLFNLAESQKKKIVNLKRAESETDEVERYHERTVLADKSNGIEFLTEEQEQQAQEIVSTVEDMVCYNN